MNREYLETLYQTSVAFRIFVDRNCQSYGWTKEKAFKDKIVQSYAEYISKDKPKENANETKANYGC